MRALFFENKMKELQNNGLIEENDSEIVCKGKRALLNLCKLKMLMTLKFKLDLVMIILLGH